MRSLALAVAGCGSSSSAPPADFSGNYTVAVTNGQNGCGFANWTVGAASNGTPVVITQNGSSASADVGGAAGIYYDVILGSHVFTGSLSGDHMSMSIHGTRTGHQGNCAYQVLANLDGTLSGDSISGRIDYSDDHQRRLRLRHAHGLRVDAELRRLAPAEVGATARAARRARRCASAGARCRR